MSMNQVNALSSPDIGKKVAFKVLSLEDNALDESQDEDKEKG